MEVKPFGYLRLTVLKSPILAKVSISICILGLTVKKRVSKVTLSKADSSTGRIMYFGVKSLDTITPVVDSSFAQVRLQKLAAHFIYAVPYFLRMR